MLPPKESPMKTGILMNATIEDLLDFAERAPSEEHLSLTSDDISGEIMMSTCSDMGYKSQEDRYLLDSYPGVFKQTNQPMSEEQNPPSTENTFDADNCTDRADSTGSYTLDSILCQFDTFFRGKLDSELQAFQESMHAMLTEQQTHIQRIISSSAEQSVTEACFPSLDTAPAESSLNSTETNDLRCRCHDAESKAKMGLMVELLSLSCQITALLNLPKFVS